MARKLVIYATAVFVLLSLALFAGCVVDDMNIDSGETSNMHNEDAQDDGKETEDDLNDDNGDDAYEDEKDVDDELSGNNGDDVNGDGFDDVIIHQEEDEVIFRANLCMGGGPQHLFTLTQNGILETAVGRVAFQFSLDMSDIFETVHEIDTRQLTKSELGYILEMLGNR